MLSENEFDVKVGDSSYLIHLGIPCLSSSDLCNSSQGFLDSETVGGIPKFRRPCRLHLQPILHGITNQGITTRIFITVITQPNISLKSPVFIHEHFAILLRKKSISRARRSSCTLE
jgi:hypothetical protein